MSISRHVRMTRTAISPRLAIRTRIVDIDAKDKMQPDGRRPWLAGNGGAAANGPDLPGAVARGDSPRGRGGSRAGVPSGPDDRSGGLDRLRLLSHPLGQGDGQPRPPDDPEA